MRSCVHFRASCEEVGPQLVLAGVSLTAIVCGRADAAICFCVGRVSGGRCDEPLPVLHRPQMPLPLTSAENDDFARSTNVTEKKRNMQALLFYEHLWPQKHSFSVKIVQM